MGKRELLIVLIFAAVAVVAYQFTAPATPEGRGFSVSRFFGEMRREIHGDRAVASHTHRGTLAVSTELQELRVMPQQGRVRIVGEDRADIAWDLPIESTGPDQAAALEYARRVNVKIDDLGTSATLSVEYPREGTQTGTMTVLLPSRMAVRLVGGVPTVDSVAAVQLEAVSGETTLKNIAGAVSGGHRNGRLVVDGVGAVNLALTNSRARFFHVDGNMTITARTGECSIEDSAGRLVVDASGVEVSIARHDGPVRVTGSAGEIRVDGTGGELSIDMRRAEVEVIVTAAHPMTLLTSDEPLRVFLDARAGVALDAVSSGGRIQAGEFGLTPEAQEGETRLAHAFGTGKLPRAAVRNTRGDIVIRMRK
jgi:hypothetical protein